MDQSVTDGRERRDLRNGSGPSLWLAQSQLEATNRVAGEGRPWRLVGHTPQFLLSKSELAWLSLQPFWRSMPSTATVIPCEPQLRPALPQRSGDAANFRDHHARVPSNGLESDRAATLNVLCQTVHSLCWMSAKGELRPCRSMTDCASDRTLNNLPSGAHLGNG